MVAIGTSIAHCGASDQPKENKVMVFMASRRLRAPVSLGLKAVCLAICLASAVPVAFAKNDHGDCNGNCEADPAPAPVMGGGILGLVILGAGAVALRRRARRG
jgi:hypothetical protein